MEFKVYEQLWFPTPVWECPVIGIDNDEIKEYCLKVREKKPGTTISNRGGWHSKDLIFPTPESLDNLFNDMTEFVNDVCYRYTGIPLKFGNFWININGKHDYNLLHDHHFLGIVDRFAKTYKGLIYKYMTQYNTKKYNTKI